MKFITEIIEEKEHLLKDFKFGLDDIIPKDRLVRSDQTRLKILLRLCKFKDLKQLVQFTISHFSFLGNSVYEAQILQEELRLRIKKKTFLIDFLPISLYVLLRYRYCKPLLDKIVYHSNQRITKEKELQSVIYEYTLHVILALEIKMNEAGLSLSAIERKVYSDLKNRMQLWLAENNLHHEFTNPNSHRQQFDWIGHRHSLSYLGEELKRIKKIDAPHEFIDLFQTLTSEKRRFYLKKITWHGTAAELVYLFILLIKSGNLPNSEFDNLNIKLSQSFKKSDGTEYHHKKLGTRFSQFRSEQHGTGKKWDYSETRDAKNLHPKFQNMHQLVKSISKNWGEKNFL